jgi:hypothetical protein
MPALAPPSVRDASVRVLRVFDVASAVSLAHVERILAERGRVARIRLSRVEPKALAFADPPVAVELAPPGLEVAGTRPAVSATARVHSFGVVSLSLDVALPGEVPWAEFQRFAREAEREAAASSFWRVQLDGLLDALRPALEGAAAVRMEEDYTIVTVRSLAPGMRATELMAAVDLVPLLTHDARPLSDAARRDVLRHTLSYYEDDLVVITWDRALVVEPSPDDDVADVLEVANAQLLELRYYDALLDRELPRVYDEAAAVRGHTRVLGGRYARTARKMRALVAEITEVTEKVDNALKVTDDVYLARVYGAALEQFRVRFWAGAVDRKLALIRDTYTALYDEAMALRSEALEVSIVLLIVLEIVLTLFRH